MGFPGAFDAAGAGVRTVAAAQAVDPAQAHRLDRRGFGFGADQGRVTGAVRLAEGVAAGHQRDGLAVVHRHSREGLAHVTARGHRIGAAIGAFGVHVDQAHLHGGQRVVEFAVAAVAAVGLVAGGQPGLLGTPVDVFFRGPDVDPAASETEGLEAHRLQRDVAGQDHQIGPGQRVAVLLLDRPQQPPCLVEVAVVGPAVQRCEALVAAAGAAAAVGRAVGAGAVPGHADEQAAVVAPVGRPPVLAVGHQRRQVALQGRVVERLVGRRVVEVRVHRARCGRVLVQDRQVQLLRPPMGIGRCCLGRARTGTMERTLGFAAHIHLLVGIDMR